MYRSYYSLLRMRYKESQRESRVRENRTHGLVYGVNVGLNRAAFTLIELLVVIAIIALLVSILLPSLQTARDLAKQVTCSITLKNLGTTLHMYASDQNGEYPDFGQAPAVQPYFFIYKFYPDYISGDYRKLFQCPASDFVYPERIIDVASPSCGYMGYCFYQQVTKLSRMPWYSSMDPVLRETSPSGPGDPVEWILGGDKLTYDMGQDESTVNATHMGASGCRGGNRLYNDAHVSWIQYADLEEIYSQSQMWKR